MSCSKIVAAVLSLAVVLVIVVVEVISFVMKRTIFYNDNNKY